MPTAQELLANAIRPALNHIGKYSQAAEELLVGTAAQESNLTHRRQLGGGPARGLFQMEPATHNDIWTNYLRYHADLSAKVTSLLSSPTANKVADLENNDKYAAAMCRVHYLRAQTALPAAGDVQAMARYWKQHYNTYSGAGTTEEFVGNWNRYVRGNLGGGVAPGGTTPAAGGAAAGISGSVGKGGQNSPDDVGTVQRLLKAAGFDPGPIDKKFGSLTLAAITAYQSTFLRTPDGLVEAGGRTISRLQAGTPAVPPTVQPIARDPGAGPGDLAAGTLTWPLARNVIRRNSESNTFGPVRRNADGSVRNHQGWDFFASPGTKLYAIGAGTVVFKTGDEGDYGVQVCCSFQFGGRTLYTFYAHLTTVLVRKDQPVGLNTVVGTAGRTGNAAGLPHGPDDHLHFEIREQPMLGRGLAGRLTPKAALGTCPLNVPVASAKPS